MSKTFASRNACQTTTAGERPANRRIPPATAASSNKKSTSTKRTSANGFKMNQPGNQDFNNTNATNHSANAASTTGQLQSPQRQAVHGGAYMMIPPNESKRQQVNQMAQREMQEFEQYRQTKAVKHVSHVGTVGGGEITEQQARQNQERAIRMQKLNRLKRQEEHRISRKKAEENEIEKKKAEARRQAEMNAARNGIAPTRDEIRSKREAFLKQLENQTPGPSQQVTQHQWQ